MLFHLVAHSEGIQGYFSISLYILVIGAFLSIKPLLVAWHEAIKPRELKWRSLPLEIQKTKYFLNPHLVSLSVWIGIISQ